MKPCVLIKILESMYYFSKNKTISLSFYDTSKRGSRAGRASSVSSLAEFERNVPFVFYKVDCATDTKRMTIYQYEPLVEDFVTLSVQDSFDFNELGHMNISDFTMYKYDDQTAFSGGGLYETSSRYIKYNAALFIQIFRLLGESLTLVIKSKGKLYHAHYIDGKVLISEITDHSYIVSVTTLFHLPRHFPDYEILDFNASPMKLTQRTFLESVEAFCAARGIKYYKELF